MSMKVDKMFVYNNTRHSEGPINAVPDIDTYNKTRTLRDDEETLVYEQKKNPELTENERNAVAEEIEKKETTMEPIDFFEKEQLRSNINKDILFNKNKTK